MCDIFVLITFRVFQRAGWRLKWAGDMSEVGAWFSNTHFFNLKKNISFSRYLDLCACAFCAFVLVKSTDFKICDVIIDIGISTYAYFFWILSTLDKKFSQILVLCKTSISNMFLIQDWRLETSFRLFDGLIKMII